MELRYIKKLGEVDIAAVAKELATTAGPLWGANTARTGSDLSPHAGTSDIWICGPDYDTYKLDEESPTFWWSDAEKLPATVALVDNLFSRLDGDLLGSVLITRIPPRGCVKPHIDLGYHAKTYEKFAVSIKANSEQAFCYEDGKLVTLPGDVFTFNNQVTHWVENPSDEERITLIFTLRS